MCFLWKKRNGRPENGSSTPTQDDEPRYNFPKTFQESLQLNTVNLPLNYAIFPPIIGEGLHLHYKESLNNF